MFRKMTSIIMIVTLLVSCAGRPANPVLVEQVGDNQKSCQTLEMEMENIQGEIQRLIPETDKTKKNVGLGVAGVFLLVPWFFMDLTDSEKIEVNAYRQRYNHLSVIASEKKCQFMQVSSEPKLTSTEKTNSN